MSTILEKNKKKSKSVEEKKNELAIKLLSLKDVEVIDTFKDLLEDLTTKRKKNNKNKYNKEIDAAVKRVRSGKSISNEKVMSEMDKW
jgi:hypothetical protein